MYIIYKSLTIKDKFCEKSYSIILRDMSRSIDIISSYRFNSC